MDVLEEEPPRDRALLDHPRVIVTPHLGASTIEAQASVTRQISLQVARFLRDGTIEGAVNLVGFDPALRAELAPWALLCRRLGGVASGLLGNGLSRVEATFFGELAHHPAEPFAIEVLCGILRPFVGEGLNRVNVSALARDRGIVVSTHARESHRSFQSLVKVAVHGGQGRVALAGTLFGRDQLRIVRAFGFNIDAIPEGAMVFCANDDQPGIIGHLGTVMAEAGINIANMSVGRDLEKGHALSVLNLDSEPGAEALSALGRHPGIRWIRHVPATHTTQGAE
jgi:hypothetical protein